MKTQFIQISLLLALVLLLGEVSALQQYTVTTKTRPANRVDLGFISAGTPITIDFDVV